MLKKKKPSNRFLTDMKQELKYILTRNVKKPERGTPLSAGIDLFVPEFDDDFIQRAEEVNPHMKYRIQKGKPITLYTNERVLIPAGIKFNFNDTNENYALIAFNKSGVAHKKGLIVGSCVVDQDYQGEVHISIINTGMIYQHINEGEKIVQFILLPIAVPKLVMSENKFDFFAKKTERGEGGFGSTDSV